MAFIELRDGVRELTRCCAPAAARQIALAMQQQQQQKLLSQSESSHLVGVHNHHIGPPAIDHNPRDDTLTLGVFPPVLRRAAFVRHNWSKKTTGEMEGTRSLLEMKNSKAVSRSMSLTAWLMTRRKTAVTRVCEQRHPSKRGCWRL